MSVSHDGGRIASRGTTEGWSAATLKAVGLLIASFVVLAVVPDRLVSYLSLHVEPRTRDAIVTLLWLAALAVLMRVFVVLQLPRKP